MTKKHPFIPYISFALALNFMLGCAAHSKAVEADESSPAYRYIGNLISNKFHRPGCTFGESMAKKKRIHFQYRRDAIESGMKPCNWCLPRWWKSVHCRIIKM
ncbi:MAG: hypothetical protein K2X77_20610 [Candidatus Obscuribacterales bacterium]|jgi:hypothetical protein|nr:hypothetical protein [Candidatus Obscuribacterales bacterium]